MIGKIWDKGTVNPGIYMVRGVGFSCTVSTALHDAALTIARNNPSRLGGPVVPTAVDPADISSNPIIPRLTNPCSEFTSPTASSPLDKLAAQTILAMIDQHLPVSHMTIPTTATIPHSPTGPANLAYEKTNILFPLLTSHLDVLRLRDRSIRSGNGVNGMSCGGNDGGGGNCPELAATTSSSSSNTSFILLGETTPTSASVRLDRAYDRPSRSP